MITIIWYIYYIYITFFNITNIHIHLTHQTLVMQLVRKACQGAGGQGANPSDRHDGGT